MIKISLRGLTFSVFLICILILFSSNVLADCCVNTNDGTCSTVNSVDECVGGELKTDSCSVVSDCQMGCCCEDGLAMKKVSCSNQGSFIVKPTLQIGSTCSCGDVFSISGTVFDENGPIGGATVSVGDKVTTSSLQGSFGTFTLADLPAGATTITASKDGCVGTTNVNPFLSDKTGVVITLVCTCTPGCNPSEKSYCDAEKRVHFYDLTKPAEKSEYCAFCGQSDASECGIAPLCKPNDGVCPLGCNVNNDADCKCDPLTPNGVCPSTCTSAAGIFKDIDCGTSFNPKCGDGLVYYPFETCEVDAQNGQNSRCADNLCSNCNCVSNSKCGNKVLDSGEACELGTICSDASMCSNTCTCGQTCSDASKNPVLNNPTYSKASKQLNVSWSLSASCDSLVDKYELYYCEKNSAPGIDCSNQDMFNPVTLVSSRSTSFTMMPHENTIYYFYVTAQYANKLGKSATKSIKTGDAFCMNRPSGALEQFCLNNKITKCDANFNLQVIENCGANPVRPAFCVGPDARNEVTCQESNPCLSCNGLYGLFGKYLDLKIPIGDQSYFCSFNPQQSERAIVPNCYFEPRNGFTVGSFKTCDEVSSCYDFTSEESCTDERDPCVMNRNCEWAPLGTTSLGVCRPKLAVAQDCTLCDDPLSNPINAKCTPQACGLFGVACNFQGAQNTPSCASRAVKTCANYDTKDKCIGAGSNAKATSIDVQFDVNKTRIGGTNQVDPSHDDSALGKCFWDASENKCRRDADGLKPVIDTYGFDCASGDVACESDFINPVTKIKSLNSGLYSANPAIRYSVSDNLYSANMIDTYFCVVPKSQTCYPRAQGALEDLEKIYRPTGLNVSGEYKLFFYSQDEAKNLEKVEMMILQIDADAPFIEIISPRNDTQIGTSTSTIEIVGRSAADVRFVCAKNTLNGNVNCLNRCDVGGVPAGTPCITASNTGSNFNITIKLNANSGNAAQLISSIVIEAVDFAGNSYSNTLGGIIYDITPPGNPIVIVR